MRLRPSPRFAAALILPAIVGAIGILFAVQEMHLYGWTVFLILPVLISFLAALIFRRLGSGTFLASFGVAILSQLLLGCFLLCLALEGVICLIMALPLAVFLALPGAFLGHLLAKRLSDRSAVVLPLVLILAFPFLAAFESASPPELPLHQVSTRLFIAAPPEVVWDQVIAFDRIDAPPEWLFRLGIAYPITARIEGTGVGAVRHCVFSTGAFIEPITRWDPPHALEFDVLENPPPMIELSPWGPIDTPHLRDTFQSQRGRFLLRAVPGGTELEGTTWYRQSILPDAYWHRLTNPIIHRIHLRVLDHIRLRAETAASIPQ